MAEVPAPPLKLRIDTDALAHNYRELDRLSGAAKAGAAVKANCYGLGVDQCVPTLRDAGAEIFYVAHWSEVAALAFHVPASSIRVLHGAGNAAEAAFAKAIGAVPVINSLHQAKIWTQVGGGLCDVMVDTGINRLGLSPPEVNDPILNNLDVDCLMSHLASADEDGEMNARQLAAFKDCITAIPHQRLSLANSAGVALGGDFAFDLTRPGLSLYGGIARPELKDVIRQVAFPEAAILQKRNIKAGESVGYNAEFAAACDMTIGVVSLGYADGFLRTWNLKGDGFLLHGETRLPLLGKVSMDMIVADFTNAPDLQEGDWVSLPYSLQNAAQQTALSQYELLTILGNRFER
ncbi:MAG: alanine racemase [Erythrobacter sp.]